jgi:membrane protease YdiL (CAAX protease family)
MPNLKPEEGKEMVKLIVGTVKWYRDGFSPAEAVVAFVCLVGAFLFARWVSSTSGGRTALLNTPPRRNNMPLYLPFIPVGFYVVLRGAVKLFIENALPDLYAWEEVFLGTVFGCVCALLAIGGIIAVAQTTFARRLKGFGLQPRTVGSDLTAAIVSLVCIWPIITIVVFLTILLIQILGVRGPQIERHEMLKMLLLYRQLPVRLSMITFAVLIAPVFEEMLFRGLFQTLIRRFVPSVWISIFISSVIFATAHQNFTHWPVLFVLALCLGYSYEKSGSLFRPIFIHALFNATNVASAMMLVSS